MTPGRVDDYVSRLEHELRRRGSEDTRIVDEAREHLADAMEDDDGVGCRSMTPREQAYERFGAPEVIAAHVHAGFGPAASPLARRAEPERTPKRRAEGAVTVKAALSPRAAPTSD